MSGSGQSAPPYLGQCSHLPWGGPSSSGGPPQEVQCAIPEQQGQGLTTAPGPYPAAQLAGRGFTERLGCVNQTSIAQLASRNIQEGHD